MRIVTNLAGLEEHLPTDCRIWSSARLPYTKRWRTVFWLYRRCLNADYLVLNFNPFEVMTLTALLAITPGHHCRIVTLDLFIDPDSSRGSLRGILKGRLLSRIHLFLVFVRDCSFYCRHYHLDPARFRYIPYKVNGWESILRAEPCDGGYIFSGGKSRRDFATLFEAVRGLPYPVKVVSATAEELRRHGTVMPDPAPRQVEVLTGDNSLEYFIQMMARARLVVIPIQANIVTQAGIAVYLMAMALGKCVIVSSGPGVDDVLAPDQAVIVPAGDSAALRAAIEHAWTDDAFRERIARNGMRYARSLGGTSNLLRSVAREILRDHQSRSETTGAGC